jgi:hypothetical protein
MEKIKGSDVKDVVLETAAVTMRASAKSLRYVAKKCDEAEKYCTSQKTGNFKFKLTFQLGDHVFNVG